MTAASDSVSLAAALVVAPQSAENILILSRKQESRQKNSCEEKGGKTMSFLTLRQLKSKDPEVRRRAAEKLGNSRSKGAIGALVEALDDDSFRVSLAAQKALEQIGSAAVKPLLTALQDHREQVRRYAAWALGNIGDQRAIEPLTAALKDATWSVRNAAATALDSLHWQPADEAQRALLAVAREKWTENIQEIIKMGDAAVEPLMNVLKGDRWHGDDAIKALGEIGDASAVMQLVAELKAYHNWDREAAAVALGTIGDTRAIKPLVAALCDNNDEVRQAVAEALGKIDPNWKKSKAAKEMIRVCVVALNEKEGEARPEAASALGWIGEAEVVEPLIAALKDEDDKVKVRQATVEALAQVGDVRAFEPLVRALNDEYYRIREAAAVALGQIGDARVVGSLLAKLKAQQWPMARKAAESLRQVLHNHVMQVETDILQEIAHLEDMVEVQTIYDIQGNVRETSTRPIDCSEIIQLAQQELARRGLEA
jgi:HEAT repeat protein